MSVRVVLVVKIDTSWVSVDSNTCEDIILGYGSVPDHLSFFGVYYAFISLFLLSLVTQLQ